MKQASVSKQEVREAVLANNTARVAEMMEEFHLFKDGTPPPFHLRRS